MNQRIEELFGRALDETVPETWTTLNPAQLAKLKTKFAELIVKECAKFTDYSEELYKHFGVEE